MAIPFETAFESLRKISPPDQNGRSLDRNEATTRLQLIDRLFFECLGWEKSECEVEHREDATIADYVFKSRGRDLIVEAKREGTTFNLPAGASYGVFNIAYFKTHEKAVYSAIEQAIRYCASRGVQFGAVSNGHQIIAFLGSRTDGISPLEGKCLVMPAALEVNEVQFKMLWDALSKSGINERGLLTLLGAGQPKPPPEKPSTQITNYPGSQLRNSLQVNLLNLAEMLIQGVGSQPIDEYDFLSKCYAPNGALSQFALISKGILENRYAQLQQTDYAGPKVVSATDKSGLNSSVFADVFASRPILLIGDVGVGKTTFIRNLINVEAKDVFEHSLVVYIDFGVKPTLEMTLSDFVAGEMTRQLREFYDVDIEERPFLYAVYHGDLLNFDKSLWGGVKESDEITYYKKRIEFIQSKIRDTHEHLKKCLEHIVRGQKRQIVIFFDNVDQRPDAFQQETFLLGESVAELWPAMVFMTLRPQTYHRSRISGTLNAYHPQAFTISPPRIELVIEKRLLYALELLESGKLLGNDVAVISNSLRTFIDIVIESFHDNRDLVEFVESVFGGNVRLALDFLKMFIGSGHVDSEKIIETYNRSGGYTIPLHEFLRAVMFGDHRWYDPDSSEIKNVFDIAEPDGREHFIVLCALAFLDRGSRQTADGFLESDVLIAHLGELGFSPSQIANALDRMFIWKLIDNSLEALSPDRGEWSDMLIRVNSVGAYYCHKLVGLFTYVDAVLVDTPLMDRDMRGTVLGAGTIPGRLSRAEKFCEYLDEQWGDLGGKGAVFDWPGRFDDLRRDIGKVKERNERQLKRLRTRS